MAWQRAASLQSIPEDGVLGVELEGTPLALYNLAARIYATHGVCTHALALLAEGLSRTARSNVPCIRGCSTYAPARRSVRRSPRNATFAVEVEGDDVLVDLGGPAAPRANSAPGGAGPQCGCD